MIDTIRTTLLTVAITGCKTTQEPGKAQLTIDGSLYASYDSGTWTYVSGEVMGQLQDHSYVPADGMYPVEVGPIAASDTPIEFPFRTGERSSTELRVEGNSVYIHDKERGTITGTLTREEKWSLLVALFKYKPDSPTTVTLSYGIPDLDPITEDSGPVPLGKYEFSVTAHDDGRLSVGHICPQWEQCDYEYIGTWDENSIIIGEEALDLSLVLQKSEHSTLFRAGHRPVYLLRAGADEPQPSSPFSRECIEGEEHFTHPPQVHDTRKDDENWTRWQTQVALLAALHKMTEKQCSPPPPPPQ